MARQQDWPHTRIDERGRLLIQVAVIRPMPKQPRRLQRMVEVVQLKKSIGRDDSEEPIKVKPVTGDTEHLYELVSGETRWLAHKALSRREIWGIIDSNIKTRKDQLRSAVRSNENRRGLRGLEPAWAVEEMLALGVTYEEIMSDFGWKTAFPIDQCRSILTLSEPILHLMYPHVPLVRDALSPALAYDLSKIPEKLKGQQEEIAIRVTNREISAQGAKREIAQLLRGATGRKRRVEKPWKDLTSLQSFIARTMETAGRYVELPADHYGRMFATRDPIAQKAVVASIEEIISKFREIRDLVKKAD